MSFKDLKEKFMGLLFTDEFVEDATFVKREPVEEVKKTVENIVREEIKEKPVEVKERKQRTRRLIQEGAILEKVLPDVKSVELERLEDFLRSKI